MLNTLFYLALASQLTGNALAHNFVVCTDAYPDLKSLLSDADRTPDMIQEDQCKGYVRAYPAKGTKEADLYGDQGYPWQGIWPLQDQLALHNHRVCNPLAENPVYDPVHKEAHVKPKSTILVQVQTNNHVHEWKMRQPGRHMIFLAGKSGTQLTTANQLTWDRLVFSAPSCKYSHIVGEPPQEYGGFGGDPGYTWLPLKLVDPTGAWLPEGTYNFVFTYFWSTGDPGYKDYMIPDYSSSFDIVISSDATSSGAVADCMQDEDTCHQTLVGKTSCPAATDKTAPWPPYADGGKYLFTNPDGIDVTTANGKRTFQPYWQEFVEATPMPAISYKVTPSVQTLDPENETGAFQKALEIAGGNTTFPNAIDEYPFILAGKTEAGNGGAGSEEGLPITQVYKPMSVGGGGGAVASSAKTNGTTTEGTTGTTGEGGDDMAASRMVKRERSHARQMAVAKA